MAGRPYAATIQVSCTARGCNCVQTHDALLYESANNSQMIEHPFNLTCDGCGHATARHATMAVEKRGLAERRTQSR